MRGVFSVQTKMIQMAKFDRAVDFGTVGKTSQNVWDAETLTLPLVWGVGANGKNNFSRTPMKTKTPRTTEQRSPLQPITHGILNTFKIKEFLGNLDQNGPCERKRPCAKPFSRTNFVLSPRHHVPNTPQKENFKRS